jgi:serine/threonine-protein kinase Chk1
MSGNITVDLVTQGLVDVSFIKMTGDPLEWRRLFKKVAVLCKDAVYKPDSEGEDAMEL